MTLASCWADEARTILWHSVDRREAASYYEYAILVRNFACAASGCHRGNPLPWVSYRKGSAALRKR